jgi:hypothetical protein
MRLKFILLSFFLVVNFVLVQAQEFGLSFSYFIPRNGYFSTPISPFSIRGLGVDLNKVMALETGASLYRMSGLNIIDVPFESKKPMTGPAFTIFVPVELVVQFKGKKTQLDIKGGGFAFYSFAQKLNYGNIDRAIREMQGWQVANASFDFKNKPGFGYHVGSELTVTVTRQWGISFECNYLMGSSKIPLTGSYVGGTNAGISLVPVDEPNAKVDFTGLEFSIGIILSGK